MPFYSGGVEENLAGKTFMSDVRLRSGYALSGRLKLPSLPVRTIDSSYVTSHHKHLPDKYRQNPSVNTSTRAAIHQRQTGGLTTRSEQYVQPYRSAVVPSYKKPIHLDQLKSASDGGISNSWPSYSLSKSSVKFNKRKRNCGVDNLALIREQSNMSGAMRMKLQETTWHVPKNSLEGIPPSVCFGAHDAKQNASEVSDLNARIESRRRVKRSKTEKSVSSRSKIWSRMSLEAREAVSETRKEMGLPVFEDEQTMVITRENTSLEAKPRISWKPGDISSTVNFVDTFHITDEISKNSFPRKILPTINQNECSLNSGAQRSHFDEVVLRKSDLEKSAFSLPLGAEMVPNGYKLFNDAAITNYYKKKLSLREKTFQITPPGYDSRYTNIPVYNGTEDEELVPAEQKKSVKKCNDWLLKYTEVKASPTLSDEGRSGRRSILSSLSKSSHF